MRKCCLLSWLLCLIASGAGADSLDITPKTLQYRVLAQVAHDPTLFTQGLTLTGNSLYESSGHYKKSRLVRYTFTDTDTPQIQQYRKLNREIFAEGLTHYNNQLYLLTWQENQLLVFSPELVLQKTFSYAGEGWGLTHNETFFIRSDGSHYLYFHNTDDFSLAYKIPVHNAGMHWHNLNELEFFKGRVWANIWQDSRIIAINPDTGAVTHMLDLQNLIATIRKQHAAADVLNGIAYDAQRDALWVTGKYWPSLFLLKISDTTNTPQQ